MNVSLDKRNIKLFLWFPFSNYSFRCDLIFIAFTRDTSLRNENGEIISHVIFIVSTVFLFIFLKKIKIKKEIEKTVIRCFSDCVDGENGKISAKHYSNTSEKMWECSSVNDGYSIFFHLFSKSKTLPHDKMINP